MTAGPHDARRARARPRRGAAEVAACERALSRFDAASDLSRLNAAGGAWTAVDRRLVEALRLALRAREDTGGRFDPTVLPALVAAGYDRSFEQLAERPAPPRGRVAGRRRDRARRRRRARARLEPGAAVDLGGIGKGYAAARALAAMREAWPMLPGGLVDLGGDLALAGETPERGPWRIAVADPRRPGATAGVLRPALGRRRHLGPRRAPLRARPVAAPPDRPGDGRAGAAGAARGHRRRARRGRGGGARDRARDLGAGRRRGARRGPSGDLRALHPARRRPDPARRAAARAGPLRREGRVMTSLPIAWLVARAAGLSRSGS